VNNGVQIFIIMPYKITSYKYDHASYEAYFRTEVVYNIRLSYIDWRHKWSPYDTRVLPEDDRAVAMSNVHKSKIKKSNMTLIMVDKPQPIYNLLNVMK